MKLFIIISLLLASTLATSNILCVEQTSKILIGSHHFVDHYNSEEQIPILIKDILFIANTSGELNDECGVMEIAFPPLLGNENEIFSYSDECWESIQQDLQLALELEISAQKKDIQSVLSASQNFYFEAQNTVELCKIHEAKDIKKCFNDALVLYQLSEQLFEDYKAEKDIISLVKDIEAIANEIPVLKADCTSEEYTGFNPLPLVNQAAFTLSYSCWAEVQNIMAINLNLQNHFKSQNFIALEGDLTAFYSTAFSVLKKCQLTPPQKLTGIVDDLTEKLQTKVQQAAFGYVDTLLEGKTFTIPDWSASETPFVTIDAKGFTLFNIKLDPTKTTVDVSDWKFTISIVGVQLNLHGDIITHFFGSHDTEVNLSTQDASIGLVVQVQKTEPYVIINSIQVNIGHFDIEVVKGGFMVNTITHWINHHDDQIAGFVQKTIAGSVQLLQDTITQEVKSII